MLYRATAIGIVLFWLTMTGLLLRHEMRPADSALRAVPAAHVVKLIFHHQQPSDLTIASEKLRLGQLHLHPRSDQAAGRRTLGFKGHLSFAVPGARRQQRVAWEGELEMNKALAIQRFRLGLTVHEPAFLHSEIFVWPAENRARFEMRAEDGALETRDFTLDEDGARAALQQFGLDPALLTPGARPLASPAPRVTARQSTFRIHGERIDTYQLTVEAGGQTWAECHVDQLGRIVHATTLLGYTLAPDG